MISANQCVLAIVQAFVCVLNNLLFCSFTVECYIMFLNVTNVCIFNRFKYFQQKTSLSLIIRHIYINGEKKSLHVPTHFLIKWKFNKESNIRIRAFHNWFNQIIIHSGIYTDFIVEYVEKKNWFFKPEKLLEISQVFRTKSFLDLSKPGYSRANDRIFNYICTCITEMKLFQKHFDIVQFTFTLI